jgi:hypothetical protein
MGAEQEGARMSVWPLSDTLIALVEGLQAPPGSGLVVEQATLDVPLEGRLDTVSGGLVFNASLPHTRWLSGFLPPVHMAHLEIGTPEDDEG